MVVTGAGGRTGSIVMKKLLERSSEYDAVGVLRSEKAAKELEEMGAQVVLGDICKDPTVLENALSGADRLVLCTSAVPKINPLSLIPVMLAKLFKKEGVRPKFTFREGQMPEEIDWKGAKSQIDVAKAQGVQKIVFVGSMGGTDRDNVLNTIGNGNILIWKRRAEKYLIDSGLNYVIIHPGGLTNDEGGKRELLISVDDELISSKSKYRRIPREDVAELCVQCLADGEPFDYRSIDVVSKNPEDGDPTTDFKALLSSIESNCNYDDMAADPILETSRDSNAKSAVMDEIQA